MPGTLRILDDPAAVATVAAGAVCERLLAAVEARGRATLVLAGGSTPALLYERLATLALPWSSIHLFWGDERHVPPTHADSNYRLVEETLLARIDVPEANVHRIAAELEDAGAAARGYEDQLRVLLAAAGDDPPRFDLVLLGMGADGHTASLFPGSAALHDRRRWVAAHHVDALGAQRITFTVPVLEAAATVLFLVTGAAKADALAHVLEPAAGAVPLPAALARPSDGELLWLVDRAAARGLRGLTDGDPLA